MRMRIISVAIVMGLGAVGIALAQQGKAEEPPGARAKLRSQVVKLRAEVEVMELEHEADRAVLVRLMKDVRDLPTFTDAEWSAKIREGVGQGLTLSVATGSVKELQVEIKEKALSLQADIAGKKQAFMKQAIELAEKRLELAEVETRYNGSR